MNSQNLVACRPAQIMSNQTALDAEYRSARWAYHRLLDFEDRHQQQLDAVQEQCAPGMTRIGRILAILRHREERRERSTKFVPHGHPVLRKTLESKISELRKLRNSDPRWKEALSWANKPGPDSSQKAPARRKKDETDEQFAERAAKPRLRSRREHYRVTELYPQIRCYSDTWNLLQRSCDQAVASVIKARKEGLAAQWKRPRWDDSNTIINDPGHYRVLERGKLWWTFEVRVGDKTRATWVKLRAKIGNWHSITDDAKLKELKLTRRKNGRSWSYSVGLLVEGVEKRDNFAQSGVVSLDWGHREHQHDTASQGLRVFFWMSEDGTEGEVLLPIRCRKLKDREHALQARIDATFNARKVAQNLPDRSRHAYRNRLRKLGVRTQEQHNWLVWEARYERRMRHCQKRVEAIRLECYTQAIRTLRKRYKTFILEDESTKQHQQNDKREMTRHRKRQNRDMSARYLFVELCERFGADVVKVPARNSTRECPDPKCGGMLPNNGPELLVACPKCGTVRDKDRGACVVLLRRGKEALANRDAAA